MGNRESMTILVIAVSIIIYISYVKWKQTSPPASEQEQKSESFRNSFVKKYNDRLFNYMKSGKLVAIVERESQLALTFNVRTGFLRLKKFNPNNPFQYWLYFPDGKIMQPYDKMCLDYMGFDFPPFSGICSEKKGEKFILLKDGTIKNMAGNDLCLSSIETPVSYLRTPVIGNCETKKLWDVIPLCEQNYYNSLASAFELFPSYD